MERPVVEAAKWVKTQPATQTRCQDSTGGDRPRREYPNFFARAIFYYLRQRLGAIAGRQEVLLPPLDQRYRNPR